MMVETIIHNCNMFFILYVLILIYVIYEWKKIIKQRIKKKAYEVYGIDTLVLVT